MKFLELEEHVKRGMPPEWTSILNNYKQIIERWMPGKGWRAEPAFSLVRNQYMDISDCVIISTETKLTKNESHLWALNYTALGIPEHVMYFRNEPNEMSLERLLLKIEADLAEETKHAKHTNQVMTLDKLAEMQDEANAANHSRKIGNSASALETYEIWTAASENHSAYRDCLHILRLATRARTLNLGTKNSCSFLNRAGVIKMKVNQLISNDGELHAEFSLYEHDGLKANRIKNYIVSWCSMHHGSAGFTWLGINSGKLASGELQFSFKEKCKPHNRF